MDEDEFQEIMRIQQQMSQRIMQERKTDRKIDLLGVINELTDDGTKRTQVEAVLLEAAARNIPENEARKILRELESDNLVARSSTGFLRKT